MDRLVTIYQKKDGRFLIRQIVGHKGRHTQYKVKTCKNQQEVAYCIIELLQGNPKWNKKYYS